MSHKGVTPTIAAILLVTISVAASGAAYTFIINAQESAQQSYEDELRQKELEEKSDINIEQIYRDPSSGNAIMMVRNTGSITLTVEDHDDGADDNKYWTLYAEGQPVGSGGTGWAYNSGVNPDIYELDPSNVVAIDTTVGFPLSSNSKVFKLVGRYGSTDVYDCYSDGDSC